MIKFNTLAAAVASALLLSTGAFAAGTSASGNQPYAVSNTAPTSTLQRSAVEADAAQNAPAVGMQNARSAVAPNGKALARAQVQQQAQAARQAQQGFAVASGMQNPMYH